MLDREGGRTVRYFPSFHSPGASATAQLEFALKYDGVNLELLRAVFEAMPAAELAAWVRATPTGKYTRRAWFLYEWLTGRTLDVPDATAVAYVDALGSDYFTAPPVPSQRHRVRDDLPGSRTYCPLVRATDTLAQYRTKDLPQRVRALVAEHDQKLLHRVAQFLYLKETKSSFEIEREHPDRQRTLHGWLACNVRFDAAWHALREIVDMPDRRLDCSSNCASATKVACPPTSAANSPNSATKRSRAWKRCYAGLPGDAW